MAGWETPKRSVVRWLALLVATLIALYICWKMLQPLVDVLLWALVLAIIFTPVHRRIERRVGPGLGAALSCLLVVFTILIPFSFLTFAVVRELTHFAQTVQADADTMLDPNSPYLRPVFGWLGQYVDLSQFNSQQFVAERLKGLSGAIASRSVGFFGGLVGFVVDVFFVIFTLYYLFRDGDRLSRALRGALPLETGKANEIFERTREVISASVYGVIIIATIQGVLGGLAFWVLGLPSALLWGVVMIFLSMIPMLGAFLIWVPAAIYLAVTGHWVAALVLAAWGVLVIGSVDNFLRPKLVGEKTRLHELLIFFSVLGGLQFFGVIGLVLGPVFVAITIALLDVLRHADDAGGGRDDDTLIEEQAELRDVPEGAG
ncbi:MAG TPA: AI-2E family transporter [Pyrinomonadaceae bacterium]|jgi:predicted PurR-regulated permease PerM|nr:AI-2E family transporter [Pyrinomonadaceae bacterium]